MAGWYFKRPLDVVAVRDSGQVAHPSVLLGLPSMRLAHWANKEQPGDGVEL